MRPHSRFVLPAAFLALTLSACGSSSQPPNPAAVCGNGAIEAGEACDDGNTALGDGCTAACLVQPGWTCSGQPSACIATCGNGALDANEECDDGDRASGDGCSASCAVEPGYSCSGAPSVCVAGCGDGIRAGNEQCDDGNQANLDGCDAGCHLEQVLRASQLTMAFAPTAACPQNAFGGAVVFGTARTQLQGAIDQAVTSGAITFLVWVRNLDDLSGNADAAVEVASFAGAVHPDYAAAFSNASQLDGWFTADGRALDASRVPTARVSGSIAGGVLSAGPGRAALPMGFIGSAGLLEMVAARLSFSAVGLSAPTVSVGGSPPGHLVSEHLQNGLQSFSGAGAGEMCGGILARSLAEIPLDSTFVTFCNVQGYTASNSFLDMLVGGCRYSTLVISTATQPDLWDPAATVLGAGGPYHLVADPGSKAVTGCTDKDGGAVSLAACLDAAAFSSIFQFAADRVIVKPACGDGFVGPGEACDDGNTGGGDGCSATCTVEPGWACAGSPSVCASFCGNGVIDPNEQCDDGNRADLDGCSIDCVVEQGWTCLGAPSLCSSVCGDGIPVGAEECDDGNLASGDGCSSSCVPEPGYLCTGRPSVCQIACGDGLVMGAEQCDDANAWDGDGCSSACTVETGWACAGAPSICSSVCGDGVAVGAEECDDQNLANGDGCSATCTVEAGWTCSGAPSVCAAVCGDGALHGPEECDDANVAPGDGCSATCTVEPGWTCTGTPSLCATLCGDGIVAPGVEECDDGNLTAGDGCSPTCTVEAGWWCGSSPSVCAPACGDGLVVGTEQCDDLNLANGDGCSATCTVEAGWTCSGAPSVCVNFCASANCDDSIVCTMDACDAPAMSCTHTPVDALCDDGEPCNGAETCGVAGCVPGTPLADGTPCPAGTCRGGVCL